MTDRLESISACTLARKINQRELSPVAVVDYFLNRIEQHNPRINAFVTVLSDETR